MQEHVAPLHTPACDLFVPWPLYPFPARAGELACLILGTHIIVILTSMWFSVQTRCNLWRPLFTRYPLLILVQVQHTPRQELLILRSGSRMSFTAHNPKQYMTNVFYAASLFTTLPLHSVRITLLSASTSCPHTSIPRLNATMSRTSCVRNKMGMT